MLVRFLVAKFELSLGGLVPGNPPAPPTPEEARRLPERHPPTAQMLLRVERAHVSLQEDWYPSPRNNVTVSQIDISWLDMISFPADARRSPQVRHRAPAGKGQD